MASDVPDDPADSLAEVRELLAERERIIKRMRAAPLSIEVFNEVQDKLAERVPVLLAALDAVLKLAEDALPANRDYGGEPIWWSLTPGEIREAIARELTGKGGAS